MLTLSHLHQLFSVETCQTYIHALRWKERPLQCPRCRSHDVDPWGTYHYRPGCKRYWCNGCKRTFNDLTNTLLHQSKRSLAGCVANFAQEVVKGQLPLSMEEIRRPGSR